MPAKVTLTIPGQEPLVFEGRARCLVGRAPHCNLRVPNDEAHSTVSRNHCLLDINPPEVMLRDFGSLNGTFLNGRLIGRRDASQSPEEGGSLELPMLKVSHGDEIAFGETALQVAVIIPPACHDCGLEIPEVQAAAAGDPPRCKWCRDQLSKAPPAGAPTPAAPRRRRPRLCSNCRDELPDDAGADGRRGDLLCGRCRDDINKLVNRLLDMPLDIEDDATRLLGRGWEVGRELGRGGMGAVYQIIDKTTRRQAAIKVLLPQVATDPAAKEMFCREINITRVLNHPHIVRMQGAGCSQGVFFFTMEYCAGGSLDGLIRRSGGRLPISSALRLGGQLLDGLEYAHSVDVPFVEFRDGGSGRGKGLVHRDLKPSNLLLSDESPDPAIKIADFGIAKAFDTAGLSGFTPTGALWGTPEYMPRQLILDFKYARPEADVWSAAATLYRMLTGKPPRDFPKGKPALKVLLETEPVPVLKRQPDIPRRLADVLNAALSEAQGLRFKSAAELRDALAKAV